MRTVTFVHTADWQLGKPFAGVPDSQKRSRLQNERFAVLDRIAARVREHSAGFVIVAGDLFDSPRATKATVSAACSAIGSMGVPVLIIPGNHDHGGAGTVWEQDFFRRERDHLAPNLNVLLKAEPMELADAVLLPCPLLRRHESSDPTAWLRSPGTWAALPADKPRIVIAHGSVSDFGGSGTSDNEEADTGAPNLLDLTQLQDPGIDFIALGDWHGTKQVGPKAWYSGTPELDRHVKGEGHDPGHVLLVMAEREGPARVEQLRTGLIGWHELMFNFNDDSSLGQLEQQVNECIGARANQDLLRLTLTGSLGLEAASRLERMLESWEARLLRLRIEHRVVIAPSDGEMQGLTQRAGDPLLSRVASRLVELASGDGEEAATARVALRELHAACQIH